MKLLVIDDHGVVREGIKVLLQQVMPDLMVYQAETCLAGLALVENSQDFDLVLLDLSLPDKNGLTAIAEFRERCPRIPLVILSASEDPQIVRQALSQGAMGYIPKSSSPQTLVAALQFVIGGNVYVPPFLVDSGRFIIVDRQAEIAAKNLHELTQRQIEVLQLIDAGLANKDISFRLGVSEKTVKAHVTAIFRFLNVVNRTQAANAARQRNLI
jgi:DNA-binding NarL/FixJ family response regulator